MRASIESLVIPIFYDRTARSLNDSNRFFLSLQVITVQPRNRVADKKSVFLLLFGFLSAYANAQLSHRPPLLAGFPNRHLMLVNFPTIWKSPFGQPQTCAKQSTRGNTTCHIGISPISGLFEFQWLTTWLRSQDYDNSMGKRQRKRRQLYRMLVLCICISGTTTALLPTFGKPVISCPYMFLTTPT